MVKSSIKSKKQENSTVLPVSEKYNIWLTFSFAIYISLYRAMMISFYNYMYIFYKNYHE